MRWTVLFDGHDLSDVVDVGVPNMDALASSVSYETVPGRNGKVVTERKWDARDVEFEIYVHGDPEERREAVSVLAMWLDVSEAKRLVLPDWPDRAYMAIQDGKVSPSRLVEDEVGTLRFTITDPVAYGRTHSATVPSGGSVTLHVGGTYKTSPRIRGTVTRDASSECWGVRLDEGKYLRVETGAAGPVAVELDCDGCTCTVAGATTLPTLESDWLELEPGEHVLENDLGSGSVTVEWEERWL